jgi:hypothetical protein
MAIRNDVEVGCRAHWRFVCTQFLPTASAYINLGVVQAQTGRLEEAVTVWKQGLAQWSKYVYGIGAGLFQRQWCCLCLL